jgi:tripartite-type tricarboxylate transporter receptor subunit TctC
MTKPNEVGLMVASTALSISTVLDASAVKFSTKDFVLVKHLGQQSGIMVVGSSLGIKNFKDFVDYSKKNPVSYGSPGVGTIAQLSGEFVANFLKTNFVHVPYKGPPVTDVVSGLVTYTVESDAVVEPMIKAGRLIPIAVYGPVRLPNYPGVPTFKELGIDDFGASRWFAVIANKSADPTTLAYLRRLLDDPALNQELQKQHGFSPVSGVKSDFLEEDQKKYSNIIKKLKINK